MALLTVEAPGGMGLQVLCPNCSRSHAVEDYPPKCKRCGTIMDSKAVKTDAKLDMSKMPQS